MHLTSNPADWYAARAAGIAAYLVLTAVVVLGLAMAGRSRLPHWPRFAIQDVHRFGGLLLGAFVTLHVIAIAIDSWLPFSPLQLAVPFLAGYRPLWTGLGIAAAELLIALAVANHYRSRMPYRWWRRSHYLNFALWAAVTLHGVGAGSDRSAPWLIALYACSTAAVVALITWRFARLRLGGRALAATAVAAAFVAGAVVPAAALGPLHRAPKPWNARRFSDSLSGQILQQSGVRKAIVSMNGTGVGGQRVFVRADLLVGNNQAETTSLQLEFLPSGALCRGTVTSVRPQGFDGGCTMPDGTHRSITADWTLGSLSELNGTISATTP